MGGSLSYGAADPTPRGKAGSSGGHGPAGSWGQVARQTPGLPGTAGRTLWAGPWWRGARGTGPPASLPLRALGPEHVGHPLVSAARPALVAPESDTSLRPRSNGGRGSLPGSQGPANSLGLPCPPPGFVAVCLSVCSFYCFKPALRAVSCSALLTPCRVTKASTKRPGLQL